MKLLIILSRVPYPLEKGDKLRAFHQLKYLAKNNDVILVCLNDTELHPEAKAVLNSICSEVHIVQLSKLQIVLNLVKGLFSSKPLQVCYFYSKKAQQLIDSLITNKQPDHIYCQLIRTTEYVKQYTSIPKTLDYMDALSKGIERRIAKANWFFKIILKLEYKRLYTYEKTTFSFFNNKTIISEQDRELINHPDKNSIEIVANGVDESFLNYPKKEDKKYDLLFSGNMSYPPNIESAVYIVEKIFPLVKKQIPNIQLMIAGTSPTSKIIALRSNNVLVSGWVKDIKEIYASSKIVIAPMQTGTGLQNKLLEAMAMGIPCISSTLANNALKAIHNENILVADSPEQYAACIIELINNTEKANDIARKGKNFVSINYGWDMMNAKLENIMKHSATNN